MRHRCTGFDGADTSVTLYVRMGTGCAKMRTEFLENKFHNRSEQEKEGPFEVPRADTAMPRASRTSTHIHTNIHMQGAPRQRGLAGRPAWNGKHSETKGYGREGQTERARERTNGAASDRPTHNISKRKEQKYSRTRTRWHKRKHPHVHTYREKERHKRTHTGHQITEGHF